ncbi:MAG: response regulator, partial [Methanobacterium sp.]
QRGEYQNASLPQIVILDMNIPKVDGMTVLETIKDDENLNKIAVIVFGTSGDSKEVKKAYKSYANCYIVKPIDYDDFENKFWILLQNFGLKWLLYLPNYKNNTYFLIK